MESEKVKEIKELLIRKAKEYESQTHLDILTLINDLESENERLKTVVDIANERAYRKKFIDEWRKEYQKELDKQGNGHIAGYPDFDLVYKFYFEQKDRISELEKENATLISNNADGGASCHLCMNYHKQHALKQFAERLKEKLEEYRLENEYFTEHEPNGNLWQMNSSVFCIEVTQDGGLVDETLKEFINE